MHYSKILNKRILHQDYSNEVVVNVGAKDVIAPTNTSEILDQLSELKEMLLNHKPESAPPSVENTVLNDDEINDVLSFLLEAQENIFPDIPLSGELCKEFMWNIPKEVYTAYTKWTQYDFDNPVFNPLLFFYIFCVDEPYFALPTFVKRIMSMIDDDTYKELMVRSSEYEGEENE